MGHSIGTAETVLSASAMLPLTTLPLELWQIVLQHLDGKSLCAASEVCRAWYRLIAESNAVWYQLAIQDAPQHRLDDEMFALDSRVGFKHVYRSLRMLDERWKNPAYQPLRMSIRLADSQLVKDIVIVVDSIAISYFSRPYIDVFSAAKGHQIHHLDLHSGQITVLRKLDSHHAISGSQDGDVRVWNFVTGTCVYKLHHSELGAAAVCVVPTDDRPLESRILATGGLDKLIKIWNLADPSVPRILSGHTAAISALASSDDVLVSCAMDRTARVWSLATGMCMHVLSDNQSAFDMVSLDCVDDTVIATGSRYDAFDSSRIASTNIWELSTGKLRHRIHAGRTIHHLCPLELPLVFEDGNELVFWDYNRARKREEESRVEFRSKLWLGYYNHRRAIANTDGRLYLFDTTSGKLLRTLLDTYGGSISRVTCSSRYLVGFVTSFPGGSCSIEVLDFYA